MLRFRLFLSALAVICLATPSIASAFSVKVHIVLANTIRDEVIRNQEAHGRPILRLMAPDDMDEGWVILDEYDAAAIVNHPQFFRGGAIGPDNTVMTGLTDPSHSWAFSPFQQCRALYDEALIREQAAIAEAGIAEEEVDPDTIDRSERAYAMGCFLHGISDNNAHHLVNFFTGQSFTLYPVDQAEEVDGHRELQWSLMNVVRHIVTETHFEAGLLEVDATLDESERDRQGLVATPIDDASFQHSIPGELVQRVYFDPTNDTTTGMWQWFGRQLVQRKNMALRSALSLDRDGSVLETMVASDTPWETDKTVIEAYIGWLRDGGLTPADYLIMLPEMINNIRQLYQVVDQQGRERARAMNDERIFRPSRILERRMLNNAFAPRDGCEDCDIDWSLENTPGGASRFQRVMDAKRDEILAVVTAYIQTIENVSNLNVVVGLPHTTREMREEALSPLRERLDALTNMNYDIVFSPAVRGVLDAIGLLKGVLDDLFAMATQRVKEFVLAELHRYLDHYVAEYHRLKDEFIASLTEQQRAALEELRRRIIELRAEVREAAKQELLDRLALDLESGHDAFDNFPHSVMWMNTYNSTVGVLANHGVADPGLHTSGFWAGPVSFDASYQVEYNQLALCDSLRNAFYPCGTSAGEVLQPDYRTCSPVPEASRVLDPPTECHVHDPTEFAAEPTAEDCRRGSLEAHIAPWSERVHDYDRSIGSYTLAYPPSVLEPDDQPTCQASTVETFPLSFGPKSDIAPGAGGDETGGASCNVSRGPSTPVAPVALLSLLAGVLLLRRRRR